MKILFIGNPREAREKTRIETLVVQASQNGHQVIGPYYGFTKNILEILSTPFTSLNTINVHGFLSAYLLTFLRFFTPDSVTTVWTLSDIPNTQSRFAGSVFHTLLRFLASSFDQVCSPTRTLQYKLLALHGIHSLYISDGYAEPLLYDIQPREYGLRNNQYGVILTNSVETISKISKLYKATKSKKKLVIFCSTPSTEFKKLLKEHSFLTILSLPLSSRGAQSIVRTAGFVIIDDPQFSNLLLQAMDANRVVIATTSPYIEEILGTAGFYYEASDMSHLSDLLQKSVKNTLKSKYSPSLRAQHHFTWGKTGLEYEHAYVRKTVKLVPFDSLISRKAFQTLR